jgi:hypothetical protein
MKSERMRWEWHVRRRGMPKEWWEIQNEGGKVKVKLSLCLSNYSLDRRLGGPQTIWRRENS